MQVVGSSASAFSPDGRLLATADGIGRVRIWSLGSRRVVRTIRAGEPLCGVAWSPDGKLIGAGQCLGYNFSSASAIRVWDMRSGRLVFRTTGTPATTMLRFSPDGRDLIVPTLKGTAEIWSRAGNRLVTTLTGHSGQVIAVAYSPNGKLVATGATDGTARVWDARTGKQLLVLARAYRRGRRGRVHTRRPEDSSRRARTARCASGTSHSREAATGSRSTPTVAESRP